jgi:hypothetical protein
MPTDRADCSRTLLARAALTSSEIQGMSLHFYFVLEVLPASYPLNES